MMGLIAFGFVAGFGLGALAGYHYLQILRGTAETTLQRTNKDILAENKRLMAQVALHINKEAP